MSGYEKITLEELGILGDDFYNPRVYEPVDDAANLESLHKEVDKQTRPVKKECVHNVEIRSFKRDFVTYCTKCGKILSTHKRRK